MWNFLTIIWNYFKVKEQDGNENTKCQKCGNKIKYLKEQVQEERENIFPHFE